MNIPQHFSLDPAYFRTFLEADVLLDLMLEKFVLLDLGFKHLAVVYITTTKGLLF